MLLDGHSAPSVAERLGLAGPNLLYLWKKQILHRAGPAAQTLGSRVAQLEDELRRVERERDILKKALAILILQRYLSVVPVTPRQIAQEDVDVM